MYPDERYDADEDSVELPPLPIPRPGEWTPASSTPALPTGVSPKPLGGGASYTSVEPGTGRRAGDAHAFDPRGRLAWEVASQLTSGMLANPSRGFASVKDAIALFDQFLNEMHAYARITDPGSMRVSDEERRRAHGAYFHASDQLDDEAAAQASRTPAPPSRASVQPSKPKPNPTPKRPRPGDDYRAIPPGARAPYAPGSSSADADDESSSGEHRGAA